MNVGVQASEWLGKLGRIVVVKSAARVAGNILKVLFLVKMIFLAYMSDFLNFVSE